MEFNGTFELTERTIDEVWLALSDPVLIRESLPGCQFLVAVDDPDVDFDELREDVESSDRPEPTADPEVIEDRAFVEGGHYAALLELSVGSVSPTFETVVTIDKRELPVMHASGEGSSGGSSFEMNSGMELHETDGGVEVEWWAEADVFGKVAQMGQRVIGPVANRVVKRFFSGVNDRLAELELEESAGDEGTGDDGPNDEGTSDDATVGSTADQSASTGGGSSGGIVARIKRWLGLGS